MKLRRLRIQNFRSFRDETIEFDNYTCFVGPNGGGKSTVLNALNVFFRNASGASTDVVRLIDEDFHHRNTTEPVIITVTFEDLSPEEQAEFANYYRSGQLIISARAEWNDATATAEVKQYGVRFGMKDFRPYFDGEKAGSSANDLKATYAKLRETYRDLQAAATKPKMRAALLAYEESHASDCVPIDSEDQFYGFSGKGLLAKHFQWIYVPAVKDASAEQEEAKDTALGQILARTIRSRVKFDEELENLRGRTADEYAKIVDGFSESLGELSTSLEGRFREWTHSESSLNLKWAFDATKAIKLEEPRATVRAGERGFLGEIARLGHGMQRSFIIAMLQELAASSQDGEPALLVGIEEPELYQHPPQARHFADVLEKLAEKETAQVIVTTHSPLFVSGRGFESIRRICSVPEHGSRCCHLALDELTKTLGEALGREPVQPSAMMATVEQLLAPSQAELFFSGIPVIVEGPEDIALISSHLRLSGRWNEFRTLGFHFVTAGGKSQVSRLAAIARGLEIPAFVTFDCDAGKDKEDDHRRDNLCILRVCREDSEDAFPTQPKWGERLAAWPQCLAACVRGDVGEAVWSDSAHDVRDRYGFPSVDVSRKNQVLIAAVVEDLWSKGHRSETLETLCQRLLKYGLSQASRGPSSGLGSA